MEDLMGGLACRYCWQIQIIQYERIQIIQYEYKEEENTKSKYKLYHMNKRRRKMTNRIEEWIEWYCTAGGKKTTINRKRIQ